MFDFKYDRYSKNPIKDNSPQIDIKKLQSDLINELPKSIDDLFNEYILTLEKQRGFKCSRQEKRKLFKNFIKNNKK